MTKTRTLGEMLAEDKLSHLGYDVVGEWLARHKITDHVPLEAEAVGRVTGYDVELHTDGEHDGRSLVGDTVALLKEVK